MTADAGTYALLTDGATVEIRPAAAGDADAVREMHAGLSPENLYLRFFTASPLSAEREAQRICRPADGLHAALLAWLDGDLVGVATPRPCIRSGTANATSAKPSAWPCSS